MVVCTLCSCYPWEVLGLPPVWYKSAPYRSRAVKDPRGVLARFRRRAASGHRDPRLGFDRGNPLLVLPMRPEGTDGWSEEHLADLVTRDSMIGTGLPKQPQRSRDERRRTTWAAWHGFGPVEPEPNEPVFHAEWEGRVLAMQLRDGDAGAWNIDMSRASIGRIVRPTIISA